MAIDPTQFLQPAQERRDAGSAFRIVRGGAHQHADAPHFLALLRARPERPRCGRAAEQREEVTPLQLRDHSITSSARASSVSGPSGARALAVLRFVVRLYFVGACTGSPPGFSPLRMRSP